LLFDFIAGTDLRVEAIIRRGRVGGIN
jgi:hypothetical protein